MCGVCDLPHPSDPSMPHAALHPRCKLSSQRIISPRITQAEIWLCCGRLRALAAESDALQAQARAAWQSLDERSAAAHELEVWPRSVLQGLLQPQPAFSTPTQKRVPRQVRVRQQGEENGRLRATLEEWSHRNARLEARLNRTRERLDAANSLLARRSAAGASEAAPGEERDA